MYFKIFNIKRLILKKLVNQDLQNFKILKKFQKMRLIISKVPQQVVKFQGFQENYKLKNKKKI